MDKDFITIALAGNPNSGKTTLFNALTGGRQYVGNWPGVTVEKKEGKFKGRDDIIIQDLPGIYSLSPYSMEEVISRKYLVEDQPDVIINIVDGTNLERNLYLTTQILELNIPTVVAVNMSDVMDKEGYRLDVKELERQLGCPVISISALKGSGLEELIDSCIAVSRKKDTPMLQKDFSLYFPEPIECAIELIAGIIAEQLPQDKLRWYALKYLEGDRGVLEDHPLSKENIEVLKAEVRKLEESEDSDIESIITEKRYELIDKIVKKSYRRSAKGESLSDKIDKIITNRWLALPIFAGVMALMFYTSIYGVGVAMTDWVNDVFVGEWIMEGAQGLLENAGAADWLISLVVDGILAGIGAPLGFLPQMAMVFLFMAILEDCGYMARVAFIMDRIFRRFGLSGRSFISFLVSTGCAVPGVMATRTIENERDRRMTMIATTAIPCSAKLPIIALVAGYVGGHWWIAPLIYFISIAVVIISCIILKKFTLFAGEPAPFVMELPTYRLPKASSVLRNVWHRTAAFLKKAGTIIFAMCVIMWFLGSFGFEGGAFVMVEDPDSSLLAFIGGLFAWLFVPLGFGNWQSVASSLAGFTAKEAVVSNMGILAGLGAIEEYEVGMHANFQAFFPTNLAAISFLMFNMFNSPCLAAVSAMYKEMGGKRYFALALIFQNLSAYAFALMVYQFGGLITGEISFTWMTGLAIAALCIMVYLLLRSAPKVSPSNRLREVSN